MCSSDLTRRWNLCPFIKSGFEIYLFEKKRLKILIRKGATIKGNMIPRMMVILIVIIKIKTTTTTTTTTTTIIIIIIK